SAGNREVTCRRRGSRCHGRDSQTPKCDRFASASELRCEAVAGKPGDGTSVSEAGNDRAFRVSFSSSKASAALPAWLTRRPRWSRLRSTICLHGELRMPWPRAGLSLGLLLVLAGGAGAADTQALLLQIKAVGP